MISSILNKFFSFSSHHNDQFISLKDRNNNDDHFIKICQVLDKCGAIPVKEPHTDWSKSIINGSLHYQIPDPSLFNQNELNSKLEEILSGSS